MPLRLAALVGLGLLGCSSSEARPPRPPPTAAEAAVLGVVIGTTPIAEARAAVEAQGFACQDASLAAMMHAAHAKHGVTADVPPAGTPASAIPGMPAGHAKYFNDPAMRQVRITCAAVPLAALGDGRDAPAGQTARLLLVAPDAGAAVALIALQRTHTDGDQAAADARATFAALERRFGAATEQHGAAPAPGERLVKMSPVHRAWQLDGYSVETTAVDLGATGISVSEELTVRADVQAR